MKRLEIKAEKRTELGKKATKKLRNEGNVPCVLYGTELKENVHFFAHELSFRDLIYTHKSYIVDLEVSGEKHQAILKDFSFHPVTDRILHCDFLQVTDKKPIVIDIPVSVEGGVAKGVKEGGRLVIAKRHLKVKGNLNDLPDAIVINPENLEIGQSIKVKDLTVDKLTILDLPGSVVAAVRVMRAAVVDVVEGVEEDEGEDGAEGAAGEGEKEENKEE